MYRQSLSYPFDVEIIHKKKKSIKRELLAARPDFIEKRIAVLGGSTTAEIKDVLELFLLKDGIKPLFHESGYNRYYEEVLFENQALLEFRPDIVFIHTTKLNIQQYPVLSDTKEIVEAKLAAEITRFTSIWDRIRETCNCVIIQNNFELPYHRTLGNLDFSDFHGKTNFIMSLNAAFAGYAQNHDGFYVNDINYLAAWFGLERWHDKKFWYSYKYALSYDAISLLAHNVAKIVKAIYGLSRKGLVLDLDNTLWGGVIGDDGVDKIQIGNESAIAEAYGAFQKYVKELKERGVILAVCSKNNLDTALDGFSHPDSILNRDDITSFKANWDPKHVNIAETAREINIGLDSLVFVDDNPAEREIVRAQLPGVEVPEIGSDILKFIEYIDKEGYFEPILLSDDDLKRVRYYEDNCRRDAAVATFASYGDFLSSLRMTAEIARFSDAYLERITQLINKTNQFNLTTKRCTLQEVASIAGDHDRLAIYGKLGDKFGDNGLVSVITGAIDGDALHIDIWLMSCRVIKREMELAMFDKVVEWCTARGLKLILGYYFKTAKNIMVAEHYARLGFDLVTRGQNGDSTWEYSVPANYEKKNKHIEIAAW